MNESGVARTFTQRVWLVVAAVTLVVVVGGALTYLITSLLVIFAGILWGVFLSQLSAAVSKRTGVDYRTALILVVLTLLALIALTAYFMENRISSQITQFTSQFNAASARAWQQLEAYGLKKWVDANNLEDRQIPLKMVSTARSAIVGVFTVLGGMVLIAFMGFYFALQPEIFRSGLAKLFPPRLRSRVDEVLLKVAKTLWYWALGRLLAMAIIGVGSTIALWAIGIPLPVTQGVIAGLANFVPNLGPIAASIPPILFGLQQGGNTVIYVIALYSLLQLIESYFITPLIDQQQVSLPPALILSAQLLMGTMAGFMGLLLATPLTAAIYILVREFYVHDLLEKPKST